MTDLNYRSAVEIMGYPEGDTLSLDGIMLKQRFDSFNPLTNLKQCFIVVEKMRELGYEFFLSCYCDKTCLSTFTKTTGEKPLNATVEANTPTEAILTAALAAKGKEAK